MALIQYCYGTNSELDSDSIGIINDALRDLISQNTIKRIKVQALPNTKVLMTGIVIKTNVEKAPEIEQETEEDKNIDFDEYEEGLEPGEDGDDSPLEGDETKGDESITPPSEEENIPEDDNENPSGDGETSETDKTESFLLVGNSGILDIDFFSWNTHFQPIDFAIDTKQNYPVDNMLVYPLIITVEYYDKEFKEPYSEMWIGEIKEEEIQE